MVPSNQIEAAFLAETINRLNRSFSRIEHCLEQIDHQEIWWRPNDNINSIGNLILHINGNLRQWILHGLGGEDDVRDRPTEFEGHVEMTKQNLNTLLTNLKTQLENTLNNFDNKKLLQKVRIQGFDVSLLNATYGTMTHLEGHTGQIIYITRMQKGTDYKLFWTPETIEQEAKKI